MEGDAAAAILQVLVQNLISVSKEEISLIRGLNKDAENLSKTLGIIQEYLNDAEMKFITDKAVRSWLKELEAAVFDADNVLDELNYHVLYKKMRALKTMKEKVLSFFSSFSHTVRRRQMALKIIEINMSFKSINEKATELGLQSILANADAAPDAGLETDSFTVDPIFIGRDIDVSRIVEMLTTIPTEHEVFSILPIVGMGGLGKTTLTRKVFNDEKIKTHFGTHIWVHVSAIFDPKNILKEILKQLKSNKDEVGSKEVSLKENDEVEISREALLKKLQEALGAKTYLLVLDDVWNEDRLKWEGFINSLLGISSIKGNGIIVTTRNTGVASIVETLPIYKLEGLPNDNCWSIIKAKTFGETDIPPEFETIGRNIAKRCQGLPLAANVVGGVLRGKSKAEWLSIEENSLSDVEGDENNISKILKLSFDHLSLPSLKKCFAYCSIFPKGYEIDGETLIELWMAEGFVQPDQRNDMETVGNKFFNLLLQNSLLQVVRRDGFGNRSYYSMHDLVHDLACSVLGSSQVLYIGPQPFRYEYDRDESSPIPKEEAKCLRTLFFKGEISDIMFSDFKCLHVLTLVMDGDVKELPSSIRKLIHLRYLDISRTSIISLPNSIGELYHLQTLRGRRLSKLPSTLKYLISLRHLHILSHTELPPEIGRLTSLQTLPYFAVGDEKGRGIAELGSLKNLKGELEISNLEKVHDKEEAKSAYLCQKPNIVKLVLWWNGDREGETNDENVLEGLQPHPNLKNLEIKGFNGRSFPLWTLKMAIRDDLDGPWVGLNNLMEIILSTCEECEEIPMLGHLPHLKSLYLWRLTKVRSIGSSFYGIDKCCSNINGVCKETIIVFPALERLRLSNMPYLTEWVEFPSAAETQPCEVKVFPCLEYLEIEDCERLMSAPSHFPCLKELYISYVDSSLPLANICGIKLTSLTKLKIVGLDGLECLPKWLLYNNQNLSVLEISECPNLRELRDDLHTLNSLEELRIECCPNLKSISYSSGFTSLRRLLISDCEGLISLPCEMVESCASSLEGLSLENLSSVTNLQTVIDCLQKLPRLTELGIVNVPQFTIGSFRSLQTLIIGPTSDSSDCVSFKKTIDGILQGFQSLCRLSLVGKEQWDSLPDQLQHLTALSELELRNFGIEILPEWFGNLSSLETLFLVDCKKLRCLPSMEAMRRLTKLTVLDVEDCRLLQQRCKEQQSDDSEWPKISHIPNIHFCS